MKLKYYLRGLGIGILVTALVMGITAEPEKPLSDGEIRALAANLGMVDPDSLSLANVGNTGSQGNSENAPQEPEGSAPPASSQEPEGNEEPEGSAEPDAAENEEPEGSAEPDSAGNEMPEGGEASENPSEPEENGASEEQPEGNEEPEGSAGPDSAGNETPEGGEASENPPEPEENDSPASSAEPETVTIVIVRGDSSYTVSRRLREAGLIEDAGEFDAYLVENGYSKSIRTGTYRIPLGATWEEIAGIIA